MLYIKRLSLGVAILASAASAQAIEIVTKGDTNLSIGGYIKAEGLFNSPDEGDSEFQGNLRQSRINVKTTKTVEDKKLTGFIEGDFYGDYATGGSNLRLRHAYVQLDDLTVGKTWNGQFLAVAPLSTEQIDFWGTGVGTISGGGSYIRPDLTLHYTHKGFRFSAQEPAYDNANLPDLVMSYKDSLSNFDYNVALTAREVKNGEDSDTGVGVSLAGKLKIGDDSVHASVYSGDGMGAYSAICVGGPLGRTGGVDCDAEDGKLISQTGYSVGYKHQFTQKLRGNLRYGEVNVDDAADTSATVKSANLIYEYLPDLDVGIEWREQNKTTLPWMPAGQQIEVMAKYTF
ncbi:porin [Psychrobacter sp. SWN149]|uniref:porin n=1 Tax=Psychrobacter sp. SWN149 TaxID=2792057 RepID=UPI0018CF9D43|nr:porin [Psychrobacter sp. SWN149]MBH0006811.1 porin [Psychrobacter sp. SWN149]